jgi:hypothetical protein
LQQLPGQSTPLDGVDEDLYPKLARPIVANMLPGLAEWCREAAALRQHAPSFSFSLVLSQYPLDFREAMRDCAMLQEAMTEHYRRLGELPYRTRPTGPRIADYFLRPCDVPSEFTDAIRSIMSHCPSIFSVDCMLVEPWYLEAVLARRAHWTPDMGQAEWEDLLFRWIELPEGGKKALASGYWAKRAHSFLPRAFSGRVL